MPDLTLESVRELLEVRFHGVLLPGSHCENGQACVRELRSAALQIPWTDNPDGTDESPTDRACQRLNDAAWSSNAARTEACLPLALLSEATAPEGWVAKYAELTIRRVIPIALRAAADVHPDPERAEGLRIVAAGCEEQGDEPAADAARAAADAARAARAARAADAADAARAAADAAAYAAADAARAAADAADAAADAADAAARDLPLRVAVACLLEAHGRADLIPAEVQS